MLAALAESIDAVTTTATPGPGTARGEASRSNGRLSHGPTSPEGKERSRRNGCKEGLTGKGIVLPEAAEVEVGRREAGFARDFQPRNAVERELVRQMALGSWRSEVLSIRIVRHDARVNAARFANWDQDERIAAVELGSRLGENPEAVVARLRRTSAGCDWMIGRWELLGNGLKTADEGKPDCRWTDADLALALNLLGRPAELRHLDEWAGRLESLRAGARAGSEDAVAELREFLEGEVAELEERSEQMWEGLERPRLEIWQAGLEIDLEAEGTRLRRYEAAADRLFRSAWRKLEAVRKERGEPLVPCREREFVAEPAVRPDPPAMPASAPAAPAPAAAPPPAPAPPTSAAAFPSLLDDSPVLNFSVGGPSRPGNLFQNKTNPAPSQPAIGRRAAGRVSLL